MSQSAKKKKQKQRLVSRPRIEIEPINQEILDSIGHPNVWTPKKEDIWIDELRKLSSGEIYTRFPPCKKPPNVRKRGKALGWGDNIVP